MSTAAWSCCPTRRSRQPGCSWGRCFSSEFMSAWHDSQPRLSASASRCCTVRSAWICQASGFTSYSVNCAAPSARSAGCALQGSVFGRNLVPAVHRLSVFLAGIVVLVDVLVRGAFGAVDDAACCSGVSFCSCRTAPPALTDGQRRLRSPTAAAHPAARGRACEPRRCHDDGLLEI